MQPWEYIKIINKVEQIFNFITKRFVTFVTFLSHDFTFVKFFRIFLHPKISHHQYFETKIRKYFWNFPSAIFLLPFSRPNFYLILKPWVIIMSHHVIRLFLDWKFEIFGEIEPPPVVKLLTFGRAIQSEKMYRLFTIMFRAWVKFFTRTG